MLSSGYVDYFNSSGYQNKLKASGHARHRCHATREDRGSESDHLCRGHVRRLPTMRRRLRPPRQRHSATTSTRSCARLRMKRSPRYASPSTTSARPTASCQQVSLEQLQDRINQINADTTNKLISLQLESGVTENSRDRWPTVLLALIGGWVVGCVVVVASAMLSRRLRTGGELAAKVGLSPIVEIPAPRSEGSRRLRAQRFQQLVNAVSLADVPDRATDHGDVDGRVGWVPAGCPGAGAGARSARSADGSDQRRSAQARRGRAR